MMLGAPLDALGLSGNAGSESRHVRPIRPLNVDSSRYVFIFCDVFSAMTIPTAIRGLQGETSGSLSPRQATDPAASCALDGRLEGPNGPKAPTIGPEGRLGY